MYDRLASLMSANLPSATSNGAILQSSMPAYLCASGGGSPTNPNSGNLAVSHYVVSQAVFGPYIPNDEASLPPNQKSHTAGTPYRLKQVTDGLSKTIMLGERALGEGPFRSYGSAWAGRGPGSNGIAIGRGA